MKDFFKYTFYFYVMGLAVYVTYNSLADRRFGRSEVPFERASRQCYQGGSHWRYCVHETKDEQRDTYLYVFHGKDQDEKVWFDGSHYSALVQKYWQSKKRRPPKVITISFGPTWVITPQLSGDLTGLLEVFRNDIFRVIEGQLGAPKQRYLVGASMGGLNVLSLAAHFPQMFVKVASLCPIIYNFTPFDPPTNLIRFLVSSGAKPKSFFQVLGIARSLFKDAEEWKQFSPYHLLTGAGRLNLPQLYLTSGLRDSYGVFESTAQLAQTLKQKGYSVEWRPNSGGHCSIDAASLGDFLTP